MIAAKNGKIAEFKTAHSQVEYSVLATVANGVDTGLRDSSDVGISTSRMVKLTPVEKTKELIEKYGDADLYNIVPTDTLDQADAIIAQSDDTVKDEYTDYNYVERLTTMPNGIVKNSAEYKRVSIFRIKDKNDVKLVKLSEPVVISTAYRENTNFKVGANTYQVVPTGTNSYKVIGTIKYDANPLADNSAGNILYIEFKNTDITSKSQLPNGTIYKRISPISSIPDNTYNKDGFETDGSLQVAVNVNDHSTTPVAKEFEIQITWKEGEVSTYKFDLNDAIMEEAE